METTMRTFIYKIGDIEADSRIQTIIGEGWKISAITPNGSIRITTFDRETPLPEENYA